MLTPLFAAIQLALAAAAIALVARGRWRLCVFLVPYFIWPLGTNIVMFSDPERFYRQWFAMRQQAGLDLLKLAIAFELAWRTFRLFSGAASTIRRIWLVILALTAAAALSAAVGVTNDNAFDTSRLVCSRVQCGALWLMATMLLVANWYRVPVHPFHRFVLTTFVAYQSIFVTALILTVFWPSWRELYRAVDDFAYVVALCCWTYAAWRPDRQGSKADVAVLRNLQQALNARRNRPAAARATA